MRQERQATIPSKDGNAMCLKRISLRTTREPCANAHDNEKDAPSHRNSASSVHDIPLRRRMFSLNKFTDFQPANRVVHENQKPKTCELYQNDYTECIGDGTVPPTGRIIHRRGEQCKRHRSTGENYLHDVETMLVHLGKLNAVRAYFVREEIYQRHFIDTSSTAASAWFQSPHDEGCEVLSYPFANSRSGRGRDRLCGVRPGKG